MDLDVINTKIGNKVKELRNRNGLTQQELADRTELTKGFISQLEQGKVSPSVETLFDLIECLGTTPDLFFKDETPEKVVYSKNEFFEKIDENGNSIQWMVPPAQKFAMEPLLVVIEPGTELENDKPHEGEEFGYVITGKITLYLGADAHTVKAGESFYYPAKKNHKIANTGTKPAKFVWVSTPPTF